MSPAGRASAPRRHHVQATPATRTRRTYAAASAVSRESDSRHEAMGPTTPACHPLGRVIAFTADEQRLTSPWAFQSPGSGQGAVTSAATPGRSDQLCVCNWSIPFAALCAPVSEILGHRSWRVESSFVPLVRPPGWIALSAHSRESPATPTCPSRFDSRPERVRLDDRLARALQEANRGCTPRLSSCVSASRCSNATSVSCSVALSP